MRKWILIFCLFALKANAQGTGGIFQFLTEFSYTQINYAEVEEAAVSTGFLAGAQLEILARLAESMRVSVSGRYAAGNLEFEGDHFLATDQEVISKDWVRDLRAGVYLGSNSSNLFLGYGQRLWSTSFEDSYRRESNHHYIPIRLYQSMSFMYLAAEYRHWIGGKTFAWLKEEDPLHVDVELEQEKGTGYSAELGFFLGPVVRVAARYEKWNVDPSEEKSDGVGTVKIPKNETELVSFVIGLIF